MERLWVGCRALASEIISIELASTLLQPPPYNMFAHESPYKKGLYWVDSVAILPIMFPSFSLSQCIYINMPTEDTSCSSQTVGWYLIFGGLQPAVTRKRAGIMACNAEVVFGLCHVIGCVMSRSALQSPGSSGIGPWSTKINQNHYNLVTTGVTMKQDVLLPWNGEDWRMIRSAGRISSRHS